MSPLFFVLLVLLSQTLAKKLPTNYEYFTSHGIKSGITTNNTSFFLNGIPFSVYSGSFHYFRNARADWQTRLRQFRAAGLNTVETYIPWNLHEPQSGLYDFGNGGSEMEDFLHLEEFLKLAQREDLFVILRPGPYICSEYNFGGYPSWLLREKPMGFRTDEENYIKFVTRYYNVLLPLLERYQFTKNGPVIMFQIENEYGYVRYGSFVPSRNYLRILRNLYLNNGIVELLVTSDNAISNGDSGSLPGVLFQTTNFGNNPEGYLKALSHLQPNQPLMVMEYWIGWFDYWTQKHQTKSVIESKDLYERILKYPSSVNIYMFQGGSNFAFLNGGSLGELTLKKTSQKIGLQIITTSYDYDSPLSEAGDYTQKYWDVKKLLERYNPVKTFVPDPPLLPPRIAYPTITRLFQYKLGRLIVEQPPLILESEHVVAMELLDINNKSGQSNGYIVYRKENVDLEESTVLKIEGNVCDTVMVLVNGELVSPKLNSVNDLNGFGYWRLKNSVLVINSRPLKKATIDLVVEEWGRMNGGTIYQYNQTFKGLWQGGVYLNNKPLTHWKIIPLEFKKEWTSKLSSWEPKSSNEGPSLYRGELILNEEPRDTYIDMRNWSKGLVLVNGFPVGKYFRLGPQQAIYLPAAFLKKGRNQIIIFEHFRTTGEIIFSRDQIYETK
ncbi:unnamed protein product [Phyllotreta striolata]|uniref:Beta-galactosidase n=1 Tax=Phyllotreta striolata TaxID=444603 RepID=A0A9N9XLQ1_PHYSR|nr:unnamed protein product [Phyllotreta striolata]